MVRLVFFNSLGSSSVDFGFVCTMYDRVIDENTKKR